jgi:hypothetical protein
MRVYNCYAIPREGIFKRTIRYKILFYPRNWYIKYLHTTFSCYKKYNIVYTERATGFFIGKYDCVCIRKINSSNYLELPHHTETVTIYYYYYDYCFIST